MKKKRLGGVGVGGMVVPNFLHLQKFSILAFGAWRAACDANVFQMDISITLHVREFYDKWIDVLLLKWHKQDQFSICFAISIASTLLWTYTTDQHNYCKTIDTASTLWKKYHSTINIFKILLLVNFFLLSSRNTHYSYQIQNMSKRTYCPLLSLSLICK